MRRVREPEEVRSERKWLSLRGEQGRGASMHDKRHHFQIRSDGRQTNGVAGTPRRLTFVHRRRPPSTLGTRNWFNQSNCGTLLACVQPPPSGCLPSR